MITRRSLEAATAALTGTFGVAVVVSSVGNGIGWSSAGVDAGTFPFITGLIITAGSLYNLVAGGLQNGEVILRWTDLKRVGALFLPAAIYIGAIPLVGMYLASGGYVLGTLAGQNRIPLVRAAIMAALTALTLYLVFERMFQVTLPRGVLGDALGF